MASRVLLPSDSKLYPLPEDYDDLTESGRREARIAACRLYLNKNLRGEQAAEAAVASIEFFDKWYLNDDEDAKFFPGFYDDDPLATPEFHHDFTRSLSTYALNVACAPRGSAKSTWGRKTQLLRLLARPRFSITYATSAHRLAQRNGVLILNQLKYNSRINDDFGAEYGGRICPPRGQGLPVSAENMFLMNGSWLFNTSAESRQRGDRPRLYFLDDPEYDPSASTNMHILTEGMDELLTRLILPMVMRTGCGVFWVGTMISRRHFLHKAMATVTDGNGVVHAADSRFEYWNRMPLKALYMVDGKPFSIWPEMWSVNKLVRIREAIGPYQFLSEYQNEPGLGDRAFFFLDHRHEYTLSVPNNDYDGFNPYDPKAHITYQDENFNNITEPLRDLLGRSFMFLTADSSYTATPTSDYKACSLMIVTPGNQLFVLDTWAGRVQEDIFKAEILKMSDRWRTPIVGVETIKESYSLFNNLEHILKVRMKGVGSHRLFRLVAIRPGHQTKASRIAGLSYRFGDPQTEKTGGLIKLPLFRRGDPKWDLLFNQIENFNPESDDCGLEHDDSLDTVAMSSAILPGLPTMPTMSTPPPTPLDRLKKGDTQDEWGTPLGLLLDPSTLTPEDWFDISKSKTKSNESPI